MLAIIQKGGPLMWVLAAMSVLALAIAAQRFVLLAKARATAAAAPLLVEARLQPVWRGVEHLDLIASIAPLVGLTGTVFGIIKCFHALGIGGGTPDPAVMAGGLSEALLTTAAGLVIAVPAQVAAHFLQQGADRIEAGLEEQAARRGASHEG